MGITDGTPVTVFYSNLWTEIPELQSTSYINRRHDLNSASKFLEYAMICAVIVTIISTRFLILIFCVWMKYPHRKLMTNKLLVQHYRPNGLNVWYIFYTVLQNAHSFIKLQRKLYRMIIYYVTKEVLINLIKLKISQLSFHSIMKLNY